MAFSDIQAAQNVVDSGVFTLQHKKAQLLFSPHSKPMRHIVVFKVKVSNMEGSGMKTEKELIDLILARMKTRPEEIFNIGLPSLTHSEFPHEEATDLKSFFEYFYDSRPHSGYSVAEVRSVLPAVYRDEFDRQAQGHEFEIALDWPHDARDLSMTFCQDSTQQAIILGSFGLGYHKAQEDTVSAADVFKLCLKEEFIAFPQSNLPSIGMGPMVPTKNGQEVHNGILYHQASIIAANGISSFDIAFEYLDHEDLYMRWVAVKSLELITDKSPKWYLFGTPNKKFNGDITWSDDAKLVWKKWKNEQK